MAGCREKLLDIAGRIEEEGGEQLSFLEMRAALRDPDAGEVVKGPGWEILRHRRVGRAGDGVGDPGVLVVDVLQHASGIDASCRRSANESGQAFAPAVVDGAGR